MPYAKLQLSYIMKANTKIVISKNSRLFSREENDIHYSAVSSLTGSMDLIRRDSKSAKTKANTAKPAAIMTTPDMAQTVTSISVAMLLKVVIEPSMIS